MVLVHDASLLRAKPCAQGGRERSVLVLIGARRLRWPERLLGEDSRGFFCVVTPTQPRRNHRAFVGFDQVRETVGILAPQGIVVVIDLREGLMIPTEEVELIKDPLSNYSSKVPRMHESGEHLGAK